MELDEAIKEAAGLMGSNIEYADALGAWFFIFPAPDNPLDTIGIGGPIAYLKDTGERMTVLMSELVLGSKNGEQIAAKFGMKPRELLNALNKIEYMPIP